MSKRLSPPIESRWSHPLGTDARLDGGRRCRTPGQERAALLESVALETGDDGIAVSVVTVLELAHGIARADTTERRERRQRFLDELLTGVPIQPVTVPIALRAGQIDGQSQAKGVRIPLSDLLIGASALELGYGVGTANVRHFQLVPGLNVIPL
jgi:predicted nucleic acid-binding protein